MLMLELKLIYKIMSLAIFVLQFNGIDGIFVCTRVRSYVNRIYRDAYTITVYVPFHVVFAVVVVVVVWTSYVIEIRLLLHAFLVSY